MADDNIPEKDTSNNAYRNSAALDQKAAQQRRMVSKLDRDELEDKYLRLSEENLLLKKHARKQEDKIKRMATKLLRLVNDKKKHDLEIGKAGREVAAEEQLMELKGKVQNLEKINSHLKEKLALTKQQALTLAAAKRTMPYNYVQSRISTGIPKPPTVQIDPRITKNLRVIGPSQDAPKRFATLQASRADHVVMEEAHMEKRQLLNTIDQLHEKLSMYELEIENLKEQNRLREAEFEEDIIKIKQQITSEQRQSVQENIDMIKLQREVKEKSTRLIGLQNKYTAMEEDTRALRQNHDHILMEMERLSMQVKEEQNRVLTLQNELRNAATGQKRTLELQEQVVDLQREIDTLKEANEKFVSSAFDLEREREWRQRENKLKVQIAQLEATLKSDLGEKGSIIDRYANERDAHEKLQLEFRELQITYFQMKEKCDDMEEKLKFFTKESALDLTELEDALVLVKQKKQRAAPDPDFLQKVDMEINKDHKRQLLELQAEYAETVLELEKTRNMLVVQHNINKDYQKELESSNKQLEDTKKEYELKLDEYARLLDIRAARIKKLEAQLRDVAYGTRQYRVPPPDDDVESSVDLEESLQLERGQNLFEIHIEKVSLSEDAVRHIGDEEPSLFCTWDFFEFESQSTPVLRGSRPVYDFTSQYIVKVDDFFLHYLQKGSCTLELHQSFGQDYRTVAACQLVFKDIFDKPQGRIHGMAVLTGVADGETGVGYGTIEYWVRLRVPMDQALRLYKERTKALGYLSANKVQAEEVLQALDEKAARRPLDNINELHIKVISCAKLKSRRDDVQPSPYCVYQFFDYSDHDTVCVRNSNNPEFHDHKTFPVPMTPELDQYLRVTHLQIYVFDDTDPVETSYIGIVEIPLMLLRTQKQIKGTFELKRQDGTMGIGTMDLEIYWQHEYIIPKKQTYTPQQIDQTPDDLPVKIAAYTPKPSRKAAIRMAAPSATSTPMQNDMLAEVESQIIQTKGVSAPSATRHPVSPKPTARRKVKMSDNHSSEMLVQDTVSQVVSGFMPRTSESVSSMAEMSTIGPDREDEEDNHAPQSVDALAPKEPLLQEQYSTEEEELVARPSPLRSSLNIESGSASEEEKSGAKQEKQVPQAEPPRQQMEDDEESIVEEISEEAMEEIPENGDSTLLAEKAEDIVPDESEESEPNHIESDSEGVITVATPTRKKDRMPKASDTVTVVVSHLSLEEDSPPMVNPNIKQLFVAYSFVGLPPQDTETPFSLPKPRPQSQIAFNFSRTIAVDMKRHLERRQHLALMLLPDHEDQGRIRFTVVSEPPEDEQDADCEDVGVAYVSVRDILKNKADLKDADIDIFDVGNPKRVIGQMNVTVECLAALQAVDLEMQVDGTY
ncbi:hypothetical protein C0Q70_19065 [Pomacea canaliculata]|uniref:C2 domain-containing protein n=1 Tax=Pomacea canaliculata TaxID=400727 RepID=A0A2T7NIC5_POMCA|nr:protein fantom-like isoform X3 [Pomacea canaliculata]PVD20902.1 hypothetical protein C0Q70_19065 [Pomacea canaliculata]